MRLFKKFDYLNNGFITYEEVNYGIRKIMCLCKEFISDHVIKCTFTNVFELVIKRRENPLNKGNKLLYLNDFRLLLETLRS